MDDVRGDFLQNPNCTNIPSFLRVILADLQKQWNPLKIEVVTAAYLSNSGIQHFLLVHTTAKRFEY